MQSAAIGPKITYCGLIQQHGAQFIDQQVPKCERGTSLAWLCMLLIFLVPAAIVGGVASVASLIGRCCNYKNKKDIKPEGIRASVEGTSAQGNRILNGLSLPQADSPKSSVSKLGDQSASQENVLKKELDELKQKKEFIELERDSLLSELQTAKENNTHTSQKCIEAEKEIQEKEKKINEINHQKELIQQELTELQSAYLLVKQKLTTAEQEAQTIAEKSTADVASQQQNILQLQSRISEIEADLQKNKKEKLQNEEDLAATLKEKNEVSAICDTLKSNIAEFEDRIDQLQKSTEIALKQKESEIVELNSNYKEIEKKLASEKKKAEQAIAQFTSLESQTNQTISKQKALISQLESSTKELQAKQEKEKNEMRAAADKAALEMERLRKELAAVTQEKTTFESQCVTLKTTLDEANAERGIFEENIEQLVKQQKDLVLENEQEKNKAIKATKAIKNIGEQIDPFIRKLERLEDLTEDCLEDLVHEVEKLYEKKYKSVITDLIGAEKQEKNKNHKEIGKRKLDYATAIKPILIENLKTAEKDNDATLVSILNIYLILRHTQHEAEQLIYSTSSKKNGSRSVQAGSPRKGN